jgi:hypothetical protein
MNFLVETKTEYTIQLVNILTPFLYEGFQSIYKEAIKIAKTNEELKIFQTFLRRIPNWNDIIKQAETKRILVESNCNDIMEDLLRAIIKANIMVLTNTPPDKKNKLKIDYVIKLDDFIHYSYIESAKAIFQNPFLFFHKYTPLELKRNQRETYEIIKTSIIEAIRKMLPINMILKEYLGQSFTESNINNIDNIDKIVSEQDKSRLMHLLKSDDFDNRIEYNLTKKKSSHRASVADSDKKNRHIDSESEKTVIKTEHKETITQNTTEHITNTNMPIQTNKDLRLKGTRQFITGNKDSMYSESYIPQDNKKIIICDSYKTNMAGGNKKTIKLKPSKTSETSTVASESNKYNSETSINQSENLRSIKNNKKKYIDREFNI